MITFPFVELNRIEYTVVRIIIFLIISSIYKARIIIIKHFFCQFLPRSQNSLCIFNTFIHIIFSSFFIVFFIRTYNFCRNSYSNTIRRNILSNNRAYTYYYVIAYSNSF